MIDGTTKVVYVTADPVAQLRTPDALNRIWAAETVNAITVPAHVPAAQLADFVAGLRANGSVSGAVITVPHKQSIVAHCDALETQARIVGAVNVVRREPDGRLIGQTFDGLGFVEGLRAQGIEPGGMRAVVVGAGGAASAIAVALLDAGVARLDVHNRTAARAVDLVERLRREFPPRDIGWGLARLPESELVVNATSVGLNATDESPIPGGDLPPDAIAADVVMSAQPTPFLAAAARRGLRTHEGVHMLAGQTRLIADYLMRSPR
jgi:shikimate dehydrogenase